MNLVLALLSLFTTPLTAQYPTLRIPESTLPVTVALSNPSTEAEGFTHLILRVNGRITTFHPRNPIECAPPNPEDRKHDMDWIGISGMKLDPSLCFYRGEYASATTKHTLLAFVSIGYASDAAPVLVVGFHADGTPYKVLERDELDLSAFEPDAADGSARLIGSPTLSQISYGDGGNGSKAPYATTYDPQAVYTIKPDSPAVYSLPESKAYNQQHYVWAGPTVSEKIAVVYNYPGHRKPFVVSDKQVQALFAKLPAEKPRP